MFKQILLASHGTQGAIAAENMALRVCTDGGTINHLIVVPEFWQDMTGDDWLNNSTTRDQFCDYLQTELGKEVDQQCDRLNQKVTKHALHYRKLILSGKPDHALLHCVNNQVYDLIVIGSRRPRGVSKLTGLRSTMLTQSLIRTVQTAILIVPYPK